VARLPRAVYILQAGLLVNAFGNGAANPFLLLYLHDVRGIPLGLAGLVAATNACTALATALIAEAWPTAGALSERWLPVWRSRRLRSSSFRSSTWPGRHFAPAVLAGIGGGTWLTLQPSAVAAVTPREVRHRRSPSNGSSRTWGSGSAV
jgi:MFS family permease